MTFVNSQLQQKQRGLAKIATGLYCLLVSSCGHSGEINVVGAYFPFWLFALLLGVAAAFFARYLFVRFQIEPHVGPLVLIYVCVTVSIACLTWLLSS